MTLECTREGCERGFDTERARKIHETQYHDQGKTDEEMLEDLVNLREELGRVPTKEDMIGRDGVYTSPIYAERFGTWASGIREAGMKPVQNKQGEELECYRCGELFNRPEWRQNIKNQDQVFCSNDCRVSYLADQTGEDALGYVDGRHIEMEHPQSRLYSAEFQDLREEILERDGYVCRRCSLSRDEHYERYGMDLHIHHLRPVADFNHPDQAHTRDNLIALCLPCHRLIERLPVIPQIAETQ